MRSEHPLTEHATAGAGFDLIIQSLVIREIEEGVLIPPEEAGKVSEEVAFLRRAG